MEILFLLVGHSFTEKYHARKVHAKHFIGAGDI